MIRLALKMFGVRWKAAEPAVVFDGPHDGPYGPGIAWFRKGTRPPRRFRTPRTPLIIEDATSRRWLARLRDLPVIIMSKEQAQELANRTGSSPYYLKLLDVHRSLDCPSITIFYSVLLDERRKKDSAVMCCSSRTFQFRRHDNRWEFYLVSEAVM